MAQAERRYSAEDYLALERRAETRNEFLHGRIFAMAGSSRRHNLITSNLVRELGNRLLDGPCEVYASDMRVKVTPTGLYTYPDVAVACDGPTFEDTELDTLLDPILLVEVLSKSTAAYDRGEKFEHYRALPSVKEVLLVDQERVHVVHYRRQDDDTWLLSETRDLEGELHLTSLGITLLLSEVYAKVTWQERSISAVE